MHKILILGLLRFMHERVNKLEMYFISPSDYFCSAAHSTAFEMFSCFCNTVFIHFFYCLQGVCLLQEKQFVQKTEQIGIFSKRNFQAANAAK